MLPLRAIIDAALLYLSPAPSPALSPRPVLEPQTTPISARLDAACKSPTSSIPPEHMRKELDSTKHQLARSNADVTRLDERCRMLEKTLKDTRELLRARDAELDRTRQERDRERALADRRHSDVGCKPPPQTIALKDGIHTRHSSLDICATKPPDDATSHHSCPSSTSCMTADEERARALSAEVYMSRIDTWSGAQVVQAVHDINSEILQFAASATEVCTFDGDSRPSSSRSIQAMHDTSARIGPNLARILANRDHSQDPILVQLALQGCVVLCVARALASFCIGFPHKSDVILSQIYTHMHLSEPQPTSSKWRALTHQRIHAIYPTLGDYSVRELSDTILRWAADIFIIAGCHSYLDSSPAGSTSSSPSFHTAGLRNRFGEQVRRIAQSACRLARVTREEIMSACFDVVFADPADPFEAAHMVDAFGEYVPSSGALLATTEIGLRCTTRVGNVGGENEEVVMQSRVLLQPKVVLESVLEILDPR